MCSKVQINPDLNLWDHSLVSAKANMDQVSDLGQEKKRDLGWQCYSILLLPGVKQGLVLL